MKISLFCFLAFAASLISTPALAIGAAGDTIWPEGAILQVELNLSARLTKDDEPRIKGELTVTNPNKIPVTIQQITNRLVLALLVFDELGNPVSPEGTAKVDPGFDTLDLAPGASHTFEFKGLSFLTGSILQSYELEAGKKYRVIAVYRAAGPNGPGFTSGEARLQMPAEE